MVLTAILVPAECALAALGYSAYASTRGSSTDMEDVGPLVVLGGSAAVGAVVYVLLTMAIFRRARGHALAQIAALLAWLRLLGVIVAFGATAIILGLPSIAGPTLWLASGLAVFDALICCWAAAVTLRRTRDG